jgi:hypothetical protein
VAVADALHLVGAVREDATLRARAEALGPRAAAARER